MQCSNHADRPAYARGFCQPCYLVWYKQEGGPRCEKHPDRPIVKPGLCALCYNHTPKQRSPEAKAKRREYQKRWVEKNRDKLREYKREWLADKPGYRLAKTKQQRLRNYGVDHADYQRLVAEHGGKCAICQTEPKWLCIDHCHDTGKYRGLLCKSCNTGIGFLGDTAASVERALAYLRGAELRTGRVEPEGPL